MAFISKPMTTFGVQSSFLFWEKIILFFGFYFFKDCLISLCVFFKYILELFMLYFF